MTASVWSDPAADRPPPEVGLSWPPALALPGGGAVLSRPDPALAPDVVRLVADPALWIDVPVEARATTVAAQRDDLERFAAHWDRHGFGYWLVWAGSRAPDGAAGSDPAAAVGGELLGIGGLRWLWWRSDWVLNVLVRIAVRAQGRGLARRVLDTALARLDVAVDRATTVVVRTRPTNDAMAALARRLGFVEAGTEERELGTYRVLRRVIGP